MYFLIKLRCRFAILNTKTLWYYLVHMKFNRAFTLIELLVVISIIGLLSSIVLASLGSVRGKARDAQRLSDLTQIRNALELYAVANNGAYPDTSSSWWGACSGFGSKTTSGATGYIPDLAPQYMPVLPVDPKSDGVTRCYIYRSNKIDYMVMAYLTVEADTVPVSLRRPAAPTQKDYAFYTPGASGW